MSSTKKLLDLSNVNKFFRQSGKTVQVLRGVNFHVNTGEIVAVVGESGCGKSTLARTIMRLYTPEHGTMKFQDKDVTHVKGSVLKDYRRKVQMVFQDPFASLNPTHSIRTIMKRSLVSSGSRLSKSEVDALISKYLEQVGLTPAENFMQRFPHELSGGQRQRVALARSLAMRPEIVIADEPVSMLDVSLRLGVMNLMLDINKEYNVSYIYITHDLASARYVASRIAVMYAGEVIEEGPAETIIESPQHPYTKLLIQAAPDPDRRETGELDNDVFKGEPPNLSADIKGCPFQFRCPHVSEKCRTTSPPMVAIDSNHLAKCHLYSVVGEHSSTASPA